MSSKITYILSPYYLFHFRNNNFYNYFITTLYLLLVGTKFLCVHDLPDDNRFGQLKHVVVLNTPNIQDLYSCVCRNIKVNI
jgi:hypothetical protein